MGYFGDTRGVSLAYLLAGTSLWGLFSAGLAVLGSGRAGPVVSAGAAVPLLVVAAVTGGRPLRELRSHPRLYLRLGLLEAVNISLYAAALSIGPVPVVVALHLTSPIMLLGVAVVHRQRAMNGRLLLEALLLTAAIALVSWRPAGGVDAGRALLGCVLALGSAAAVTALIMLVARESAHRDPTAAAGWQLGFAAVLSAPFLLGGAESGQRLLVQLLLGAALLGPGFALYWRAMRHVDAPTAGALGLSEAVVASTVVAILDRSQISLLTVVAGVLVAIAVLLDVRERI
ncbi:EamA family transporter [Nocardia amikacinitolerans]|uniref:EamA family transporter n=1 Tax=Nocardia amikacinitolerans TaxID=756689 RepID=UPI0036B11246